MESNNLILNRFFTQYIFRELLEKNSNTTYENIIKKYITNYKEKANIVIIKEIYNYMSKKYRNEYFYQNTLINKLLLGRHSLNTTTALTQIPISKSKADFILINGRAVVYEIKTELDSFERLQTQLNDYYKAFNFVSVVTCEENYDKLLEKLKETPVGIVTLTSRNTFSRRLKKEPVEYDGQLNHYDIFKVLRKSEINNILIDTWGKLPEATPVRYYDACLHEFRRIPLEVAHKAFVQQLKKRKLLIEDGFKFIPYELRSLMYFSKFSYREYHKLKRFLEKKYEG